MAEHARAAARVPRISPTRATRAPARRRLASALGERDSWSQLCRFVVVGASGYVVNLAAYALLVDPLAVDYRLAAVLAFVVAIANNFVLNRHWTFAARDGHAGFQALRFLIVSAVAFGVTLLVLTALVDGAGLAKVPAQALAVIAGTPVNFLGCKLWSFRP